MARFSRKLEPQRFWAYTFENCTECSFWKQNSQNKTSGGKLGPRCKRSEGIMSRTTTQWTDTIKIRGWSRKWGWRTLTPWHGYCKTLTSKASKIVQLFSWDSESTMILHVSTSCFRIYSWTISSMFWI